MSTDPGAKSFWGWGLADRFPDRETRAALGEQVSARLGFAAGELRDPPRIEALRLPAPARDVPPRLEPFVTTALEERVRHTYGRGYGDLVRGFAGDFAVAPDWVAIPSSEAQIRELFDWCAGARFALIPFGGGTSVVRGVERPGRGEPGVVSLDLRRFDRVLEVDPISRAARIAAGATGPALEAQLAVHGLTLRHYPQSFEHSTLGGWIATRAGGHYATLRTRIDDFVESVRMVSPAGVLETRRLPSSGAGPSPERWVLGSEGTLGVITEAWLRVSERPRYRARASVHFATFAAGAEAARRIVQAGLHPANCRLLDPVEAELNAVASGGAAVLLLAFESADHSLEGELARAIEIARDAGGTLAGTPSIRGPSDEARSGGDAERWREAFFAAPYLQNVMVSLGVIADTFETACTWQRFPDLHQGVTARVEAALARVAGAGRVSCRLTHVYPDGPAPYFTFLAPARRGAELEQWTEIKTAASEAILALGGTITHHHAVGRLHRPWYDRERPEVFAQALSAAKRALDPSGILNPGVLIDP